ncbi:MAG: histidine phosphatase family protein [Proteobacteria bacterium]|nr:histidine phosphatase family protein [Pseudomonadota bacterium]
MYLTLSSARLRATQARRIADWLRERRPQELRILVSPAERCQQTARALALPFEVETELGIGADAADILTAAGWPEGNAKSGCAVLLVGHQPTLGRLAAFLLSGEDADWNIKKGALWWFSSRTREGGAQTVLRAMIGPDMI